MAVNARETHLASIQGPHFLVISLNINERHEACMNDPATFTSPFDSHETRENARELDLHATQRQLRRPEYAEYEGSAHPSRRLLLPSRPDGTFAFACLHTDEEVNGRWLAGKDRPQRTRRATAQFAH